MKAYMIELGKQAKLASKALGAMGVGEKNRALEAMARALIQGKEEIQRENEKDLVAGREAGLSAALLDRLTLTEGRIEAMAEGLRIMKQLDDPVGQIVEGKRLENDLIIERVRVPLGVIGMVYESRPNVTADAAGLALKSGNAIILRGGKEAIHSNRAIAKVLNEAGQAAGLPAGAIQLIQHTDRVCVEYLATMEDYVDVVIPRGGQGLKKALVAVAKVPVIVTGAGICHTYVDRTADLDMALDIVKNAKVQRPGVCNALETLLVHEQIAGDFLPEVDRLLGAAGVDLIGCEEARSFVPHWQKARDADWSTEYLALTLSVKVVSSMEEAIAHIDQYGTKHSEAILTESIQAARLFQQQVDASAVYVNASTRFTDGSVFGFGGEIGISTQKLHARGPMGLEALTTTKYLISGNGQIRQ